MDLKAKLTEVESSYEKLEKELADPDVLKDQARFLKLAKKRAELEELIETFREYRKIEKDRDDAKAMLEAGEEEKDFLEELKLEIDRAENELSRLEEKMKLLLIPSDPNDEKNIIVEIRAGTGGEEAALFAGVLYRMYTRYAEKMKWKVEIMSSSETEMGGFKEIIFMVSGNRVYSRMKYESGVHRVQRVPVTEASGRIHTSTATVAVLPEAEDVEVEINPADLKIDVFRSSGPGGQSVNTTDSAVRVTHLPTGMVVQCQDEKSQIKNRAKAIKVLKARLLDMERQKQHDEIASQRRSQVGTGERSERIRTYNYPQNRVSDHRINLTLYKLETILDGELDEIIDALQKHYQTERLKNLE